MHGHVEDNEGNSLPGATVFIQDKNLGKITDNTGAFTFHNLCKSDYTLIINFIGYTSDTLLISLDKDYSLVIQLNPDDLVLSNINIVADKTIDPNASFSLSGEQLERTRGQTLGETVKQISGVTTLQ
ncbi:MAG: carboxypeptidase-like regulatory domain-containing protein, partial [Cyclobacteriaceae bacterium]|nr:carboxypeptidase-like regulatory domain-containing protein [Cyclobacteriaceae bacterium]